MIEVLLNGIAEGCLAALLGLGVALPFAVGRFLHFAHGAVCVLGVYLALALTATLGPFVAVAVGCSLAMATCVGVDYAVYRPLRLRQAGPAAVLIASIGTFAVLESLVGLVWGAQERSLGRGPLTRHELWPGVGLTSMQVGQIGLAAVVFAGLAWVWHRARLGLRWRACAEDPLLAELVGIDVGRETRTALVVGTAVGVAAAYSRVLESSAYPAMGMHLLLLGVVAAVVGGLGWPIATLWGGIVVGLLRQGVGVFVSSRWQDAIVYGLLVLLLLFRPGGIWGDRVASRTS